MPFDLKKCWGDLLNNDDALFHEIIQHEMKVSVDDMIAKMKNGDHLVNLGNQLMKYQFNNLREWILGATSDRLIDFNVSRMGIKIDSAKMKAIHDMPKPRTERGVPKFLEGLII